MLLSTSGWCRRRPSNNAGRRQQRCTTRRTLSKKIAVEQTWPKWRPCKSYPRPWLRWDKQNNHLEINDTQQREDPTRSWARPLHSGNSSNAPKKYNQREQDQPHNPISTISARCEASDAGSLCSYKSPRAQPPIAQPHRNSTPIPDQTDQGAPFSPPPARLPRPLRQVIARCTVATAHH